ncbi:MAG: hypothetical protein OEX08_02790 [Candidatus Nomurabacteria bacterium]|nr:hypothetical protein [Candidatus Nomurabacteria bacterium]
MKNNLPTSQIISDAWRNFISNFWKIIGIMIAVIVISMVMNSLVFRFSGTLTGNILGQIISFVIGVYLAMGLLRIFIDTASKKEIKFSNVFKQGKYIIPGIVVTLLTVLFVGLGLIALVIPGIIVALGIQFAMYTILDHDEKRGWLAVKHSWDMTKGVKWKLFGLTLYVAGLNLLVMAGVFGLIFIPGVGVILSIIWGIIGLLIVAPYSSLIPAQAYVFLKKQHSDSERQQ